MTVTCGIDWAEAHHDVALVDAAGAVVARCRIDTGAQGFNELLALIAEHGGTAEDTPVALVDIDTALETCDILIVLVDHDLFKSIPLSERAGKIVYDTRGIWPDQPAAVAAAAPKLKAVG